MNNQLLFIASVTGILSVVFFSLFVVLRRISKKEAFAAGLKQIAGSNKNIATDIKIRLKKRTDISRKLRDTSSEEEKKKNEGIKFLLIQAGYPQTSKARFWVYSVIFAVLFVTFLRLIGIAKIAVVLFGFVGLFGLPRSFLRWKIKRRQRAFLEEFADALDAMVRLLRAGLPVAEAVAMCGREFKGPVGTEMAEIYENQKVGLSLASAIAKSAERMPITEMKMFATGVAIQSETGASLSEILTNLSKVIRARFRLKRRVQALAAEAKASAIIIGALPLLVGFGMNAMNPGYSSIMFEEFAGKVMLWGAGLWMCMGVWVMKQMIDFKV